MLNKNENTIAQNWKFGIWKLQLMKSPYILGKIDVYLMQKQETAENEN